MADMPDKMRQHLADRGMAMADGGYPIRNRQDLAKAILAFGRAKDPQAVKRWIIKRARELDAIDALPTSWGIRG